MKSFSNCRQNVRSRNIKIVQLCLHVDDDLNLWREVRRGGEIVQENFPYCFNDWEWFHDFQNVQLTFCFASSFRTSSGSLEDSLGYAGSDVVKPSFVVDREEKVSRFL